MWLVRSWMLQTNFTGTHLYVHCGGVGATGGGGGGRRCQATDDPTRDPYGFVWATDGTGCDCTCTGWQSTSHVTVTNSTFDYCNAAADFTWTPQAEFAHNQIQCSPAWAINADCGGVAFYGMGGQIHDNVFDGAGKSSPSVNARWIDETIAGNFGGPVCPAPCTVAPTRIANNLFLRQNWGSVTLSSATANMEEYDHNIDQIVVANASIPVVSVMVPNATQVSVPVLHPRQLVDSSRPASRSRRCTTSGSTAPRLTRTAWPG